MADIRQKIEVVEAKWLENLYSSCKDLFSAIHIPSHDHDHHKRVWSICKEIIIQLNKIQEIDIELIEACIISSFFHDTGLTKTLSENHGFESRMLCEKYFKENSLVMPVTYNQILEAVEKHDDKQYKSYNQDPYSLLTILCAADDMDAFGRIGVVRYTEIYLLRGIGLHKLPHAVIENLDKRFANFERNYSILPELFKKYKTQYIITREFFAELAKELF